MQSLEWKTNTRAELNACDCGNKDPFLLCDGDEVYVRCDLCGKEGPLRHTAQEAIDCWNRGIRYME